VSPTAASLRPGEAVTVAGSFTAQSPVSEVTLAPRVPAGWTVAGPAVTAGRLEPGQRLAGSWVVTAPPEPTFGYRDLPVVAGFRPADHRPGEARVEDEATTRIHTWRPLPAGWTYLSDRPWLAATNGDGPVERDLANGGAAAGDGRGIALRRVTYGKGLGTHAAGEVSFDLGTGCTSFAADVGVDDEAGLDVARQRSGGTASFVVLGDGAVLAESGTLGVRTPARTLRVDVTGVRTLTLRTTDAGDGSQHDHASWGDARIQCVPN
jgi:hypothetical protein